MEKNKYKNQFLIAFTLSILLLMGFTQNVLGQCTCSGAFFGSTNVSGWTVGQTANIGGVWAGERSQIFNTVAGATYRVSTCGASYDTQLTIYNSSCGFLAYNDDNGPSCSGTQASVDFTSTGGTIFARLNQFNCATNSTGTTISVTLLTLPCVAPGNPADFGLNVWNVYAYNGNNFNTYQGFYTENNLNFDSGTRWANGGTPSSANATSGSAYSGCAIPADNHSFIYKRQGFPADFYTIDIGRDDDYILFVNGVQVSSGGCCGVTPAAWSGFLDGSSTVEIRFREFGGGSYGLATFNSGLSLTNNYQEITACDIKVYDSGGSNGNYTDNQDRILVIYPTSPDQILSVTGNYNTESGFDFIKVLYGASSDNSTFVQDVSGTGTINYFAPGPGMPITIKFLSDGSNVASGFDFDVNCDCESPLSSDVIAPNILTCGGQSSIVFENVLGFGGQSFVHTTFSNNTLPFGAAISGNASVTSNYTQLTPATNGQGGSLVFDNVNSLNGNEFLAYFNLFAGNGGGADGLSFSYGPNIPNNPVGSEAGHGDGVKISWDSYNNGAGGQSCNGTNYSNVYLSYGPTLLACYSLTNYSAWRGDWRLMVVDIDELGRITVSNEDIASPVVYFNQVQLPPAYLSADKSSWRVAFSARTGGVNDAHRIDDVNIIMTNQYEYSINNGVTWTENPSFNNLSAGSYDVKIRNKGSICGDLSGIITISEPPSIPAVPNLSDNSFECYGNIIDLESRGLSPGGFIANQTAASSIIGISGGIPIGANWTLEAWVEFPLFSSGTYNTLFRNGGSAGGDHHILTQNNILGTWSNSGAPTGFSSSGFDVSSLSGWNHITAVGTGTITAFYINGNLVGFSNYKTTDPIQLIGGCCTVTGSSQAWGTFDNIRIWNTAKSEAAIRADMYLTNGSSTNLVAQYSFDSGNANCDNNASYNATNIVATSFTNQANFFTYEWSGGHTPSLPAPSTSEVQNTSPINANGTFNYIVTATGGNCSGTISSTPIEKRVNTPLDISMADEQGECGVNGNDWVHIFGQNNERILASINSNGQNLGNVSVELFYNSGNARFVSSTGSCSQQQAVMNRNFIINSDNNPLGSVGVRLYFTDIELAGLIDASLSTHSTGSATSVALSDPNGCLDNDDLRNINELFVTQISGGTEDNNFDAGLGTFILHTPSNNGIGNTTFGANYVEFSVTQFSEFWLHGSESGVPLPVELLSFTANAIDNEYIQLNWKTATEINNEGFEVERSLDGVSFETIGWVEGNGNTTNIQAYQFNDFEASIGMNYYRLKQIDFDGKFEYTPIVSAKLLGINALLVSNLRPNPARDEVFLDIETAEYMKANLVVYNHLGQQVHIQNTAFEQGKNEFKINTGLFTSGSYTLTIESNQTFITKRFIISK